MAQRYKVRLGDGTFLTVDLEGLRAWVGDRRAVVQAVGSQQWRPLADVLAEEQQQARLLRALIQPQPRTAKPATADVPAPAAPPPTPPPPAPTASPWETPAASAPWEPAAPGPAWEPPAPAPAWEPPPPPAAPAWDPPPEPAVPAWEPPPTPAAPAWEPPPETPSPSFGDSEFGQPTRFDERSPFDAPAPVARPNLQVLADEPAAGGGPASASSDDAMPVIPMKPVDDAPAFQSAWSDEGEAVDREQEEDEELRRGRLDGPLLTVLEGTGGFLSRFLAALAPRLRGIRLGSSGGSKDAGTARGRAVADDDELEADDERPSLAARVSGWFAGLRERVGRDSSLDAPEDEPEREQVGRSEPVAAPPPRPAARPAPMLPREPVQVAPPPIASLPVVPLAPSREPRERHDVYDGDEGFGVSLGPLWQWTKRLVVWGALVYAVVYAVREREVWFPKAADVGQEVFREVDRQVLSREREEKRRQALATATARLPGLAPETILLVFDRNPQGVEEAPEVFQVAREAADRGRDALDPQEGAELRELERQVIAALSTTERNRVAEYDRTRARRVIFPFENPHVMELVARGTLALPEDRRERLQALTHKAVVAGIDRPPAIP